MNVLLYSSGNSKLSAAYMLFCVYVYQNIKEVAAVHLQLVLVFIFKNSSILYKKYKQQ